MSKLHIEPKSVDRLEQLLDGIDELIDDAIDDRVCPCCMVRALILKAGSLIAASCDDDPALADDNAKRIGQELVNITAEMCGGQPSQIH
jgi:hypothetical protein